MTKLRKSPDRNSFQKEKYLERQSKKGKTPENDDDTLAMIDFYTSWDTEQALRESDPDWQKNNLEYDLRSSDYIAEKCKKDSYAQNLYAALCNNDFTKNDVWPLLKGEKWSCSWRYAGGLISNIREQGDYIDWYCSGIRGSVDMGGSQPEIDANYVGEGQITDEIRADLLKLGWTICDPDTNE